MFVADRLILVLLLFSMHVLIQAHWGSADSCRSGHYSGRFETHVP